MKKFLNIAFYLLNCEVLMSDILVHNLRNKSNEDLEHYIAREERELRSPLEKLKLYGSGALTATAMFLGPAATLAGAEWRDMAGLASMLLSVTVPFYFGYKLGAVYKAPERLFYAKHEKLGRRLDGQWKL